MGPSVCLLTAVRDHYCSDVAQNAWKEYEGSRWSMTQGKWIKTTPPQTPRGSNGFQKWDSDDRHCYPKKFEATELHFAT